MIVSLNWLKKYVDIKIPTNKLVELIGARLVEVEEAIDLAPKYAGIKIVEVKSAEKVEGSDHLSKCQIWDGKTYIQVVCGAPNVRSGMLAVWLPPKIVLPATFNEEPLVLDKRKIMGVESAGMLAAMDELDLGDDHDGIIEIDPKDAKPGDDFATVFGLDDILLDIENKSLTHRPDCFGIIGFAREVAGILGQSAGNFINHPDKNNSFKNLKFNSDIKLEVTIDDAKLCPRYQAVVLDGFNDKPAKYLSEMTVLLAKSGMRSINPIVDVTNYLMLLSGQPLHAFDYDKLVKVGGQKEARIIVRAAKKGEKLELLDSKIATLDPGDIIITSNNVPVALAGAMGGANTEIDKNTRRIIIESATFNLYNLRGTQFRHGIFSEAITRFTKGQPAGLTDPTLREAIRILTSDHGMKATSQVTDAYPKPAKAIAIKITTEQVNNLLGSDFTMDDIITTLENVGFKVKIDSSTLMIKAPWWRTDIHIPEDIIEEVGRLNGYDNIPLKLPTRGYTMVEADELGDLKSKIRQVLSNAGVNEILTYSFVSERLLNQVGQDPNNSYKIINSISPELQYVRQMITPSLLEKVRPNTRDKFDEFALFEMNQIYDREYISLHKNPDGGKVPIVENALGLTLVTSKNSAFYIAKKYADELFRALNVEVVYGPVAVINSWTVPFEKKHAADIRDAKTDKILGIVGEYSSAVKRNLKLPNGTAGLEVNLDNLALVMSDLVKVTKHSRFSDVERDLTFCVDASLEYAKLENLIRENLGTQKLWFQINPVSIYQGDDKSTKNISFKLTFASYDKTLNGDEIAQIIDKIVAEATKKLNAKII